METINLSDAQLRLFSYKNIMKIIVLIIYQLLFILNLVLK